MTVRYTRRNLEHHHQYCLRTMSGCVTVRKYRRGLIFVIGAIIGLTIALYQKRLTNLTRNNNNNNNNRSHQQGLLNMASITVVIILGEMLVNGTEPSGNLKSRIQAAQNDVTEKLGNSNALIHVIFTGGDTARVNKTEASVMKELWEELYETNNYDTSKRIVFHLEHQSLSTCQNAYYSIPILEQLRQLHWPDQLHIVLVTSDYHVARAQLLFEQVFQTVLSPQNATTIFQIDDAIGASTMDNVLRKKLFQTERYWLQPQNLEKLLYQMPDHPFPLPTTARIRQAHLELDRRE